MVRRFKPSKVVRSIRPRKDRFVRFLLVVYEPRKYYVIPDFYEGLDNAKLAASRVALRKKATVQIVKAYEVEDYGYDYCYKDNMRKYRKRATKGV